jgi:hypothetical protein
MSQKEFIVNCFANEKLLQKQNYTIIEEVKKITVQETGFFMDRKDVVAKCEFVLSPTHYNYVNISYEDSANNIDCKVEFSDQKYTITSRGNSVNYIHHSSSIFLFDGPNPMFDYYNSIFMIGLRVNEKVEKKVFGIDWFNGNLIESIYKFERNENIISIDKGSSESNSKIVLCPDDYEFESYISGDEKYDFIYS